jgi:hypothetical protein
MGGERRGRRDATVTESYIGSHAVMGMSGLRAKLGAPRVPYMEVVPR